MWSLLILRVRGQEQWVVALEAKVRETEYQGRQKTKTLGDRAGKCNLILIEPLYLQTQRVPCSTLTWGACFFFPDRIYSSAIDFAVSIKKRKLQYLKATTPTPYQWSQLIGKYRQLPPCNSSKATTILKIFPSQEVVAAGLYHTVVVVILCDSWCELTCMYWVCYAALSSPALLVFLYPKSSWFSNVYRC